MTILGGGKAVMSERTDNISHGIQRKAVEVLVDTVLRHVDKDLSLIHI